MPILTEARTSSPLKFCFKKRATRGDVVVTEPSEKCVPTFEYYGWFAAANDLNERAKAIYERA